MSKHDGPITTAELYADERRGARDRPLRPSVEQLPIPHGPVCFCGSVTWHNPTCPTGIQRTYAFGGTQRVPMPDPRYVPLLGA